MTYFKYEKIEESYQTRKYLLNQIINKALLTANNLYPSYKFLFIFNNITNHFIYTKMYYKLYK